MIRQDHAAVIFSVIITVPVFGEAGMAMAILSPY